MLKASLGSRSEIALITLLLLGSCGSPAQNGRVRVDLVDADARNALARVLALEKRVGELEQQVAANERNAEIAFAKAAADRKAANANTQTMEVFKDQTSERLERIERRLRL